MKPDSTYVSRLLMTLRQQLDGFHRKIDEIEKLRYLEDKIQLGLDEKQTGIEVRTGLSADLIENVKASLCSNPPRVTFRPLEPNDNSVAAASKRSQLWNDYFQRKLTRPSPLLTELVDAMVGGGIGILKAAVIDYNPPDPLEGETQAQYDNRYKALKRLWGPPIDVITVHPLSYFMRFGRDRQIVESIEHSWKPRVDVYRTLGIHDDKALRDQALDKRLLGKEVWAGMIEEARTAGTDKEVIESMISTQGQPEQFVRPLPAGMLTNTLALVTEYWSPDWYQVYVNRRLVYEEESAEGSDSRFKYFPAIGVSTSSTDPDKLGQSVAEVLRHNEPTINRAITRMAEAAELLVRKRLTIQLPEGSTDGTVPDDRGMDVPRKFTFSPDYAEALPAGAKVVDPYDNAQYVFEAMPMIQLLMNVVGQHGVSPIMKGMPPSAAGSGYRDNSLYMMSRAKFQYLVDSYAGCLTDFVRWAEQKVVESGEPIYCDEFDIDPDDIRKYPCFVEVSIDPVLPQNTIAEGEFYNQMYQNKIVPKRIVLTKGLNEADPVEIEREQLLDDIKEALKPALISDVLASVGSVPAAATAQGGNGAVPPNPMNPTGPGGAQQVLSAIGRAAGRQMGGYATGGQPRQPAIQPGATQPGNAAGPGGVNP